MDSKIFRAHMLSYSANICTAQQQVRIRSADHASPVQ